MRWVLAVALMLAVVMAGSAQAQTTTAQKVKAYERKAAQHEATLRFFSNRPWLTVPSKRHCWQATGWHRRKTCRVARREVANTRARLANVERMIDRLTTVSGPVGNVTAWNCIHRHERHPDQGWATNTGNGYYGGLQMDYSFMDTYGHKLLKAKGTADNWTPYEQMVVAERARASGRGYYPWPNTARACGLI